MDVGGKSMEEMLRAMFEANGIGPNAEQEQEEWKFLDDQKDSYSINDVAERFAEMLGIPEAERETFIQQFTEKADTDGNGQITDAELIELFGKDGVTVDEIDEYMDSDEGET